MRQPTIPPTPPLQAVRTNTPLVTHVQEKQHLRVVPTLAPEEQFGAGVRTLADLVAPGLIEVHSRYLCIDDRFYCAFLVIGLPADLIGGWGLSILEKVKRLKFTMDISWHTFPLDRLTSIHQLEFDLVRIQSEQIQKAKSNHIESAHLAVGKTEHRGLIDDLTRNTDRTFSLGVIFAISAATLEELEHQAYQLEMTLDSLGVRTRRANLQHDEAYLSQQPLGIDSIYTRLNINKAVAMLNPFAGTDAPDEENGIFIGHLKSTDAPIFIDPFSLRLPNASVITFGKMGKGKSYFGKLLGLRLLYTGEVKWVVLARDAEYDPLCAAIESQKISFGAGSTSTMNMFDLPFTPKSVPNAQLRDVLTDFIMNSQIPMLIPLLGTITHDDRAIIYNALVSCFDKAQISHEGVITSLEALDYQAPLLSDLVAALKARAGRSGKNPAAGVLAERLEMYTRFFSAPTNITLQAPLTVFSTEGLDSALYAMIIALARTFVARDRALHRYKDYSLLTFEEAWEFTKTPEALRYMETSARTLRKQGGAQIIISQNPGDIDVNITGLASMRMLFGMSEATIKQVAPLLGLTPRQQNILSLAQPGEGLFFMENECYHVQIAADEEEHQLITTNYTELLERARATRQSSEN